MACQVVPRAGRNEDRRPGMNTLNTVNPDNALNTQWTNNNVKNIIVRTYGQERQKDGRSEDRRKDGQTDGQTREWTDTRTDGQ